MAPVFDYPYMLLGRNLWHLASRARSRSGSSSLVDICLVCSYRNTDHRKDWTRHRRASCREIILTILYSHTRCGVRGHRNGCEKRNRINCPDIMPASVVIANDPETG